MICKSSFDDNFDFSPYKSIRNTNNENKNDVFIALSQRSSCTQDNIHHKSLNIYDIPEIDSEILFQSDNLLEDKEGSDQSHSMDSDSMNISLKSFENDLNFYKDNGSIDEFNMIQKNAKKPKIMSKIQIIDYFHDLIRKEIKIPYSPSKEELFDFIEPYSIQNYASSHFRKQNSVLFFGFQTIEELTTFSNKPQSKPLLEKVPITKKNSIIQLSTLILTFIGVLDDNINKDNLLISIIGILHDDDTLIDEFFMQIIKTMRNSPSYEALLLSWKLFMTVSALFYVKDNEVSYVIRWFLIHNIFEEDIIGEYANYAFILFYERSIIGRNFDSSMQRQDILNISRSFLKGNEMFKCSLYAQMWNQKREYPNLPIPLTLYLVVKNLIKNGVMMTKHPFPDLGVNTKNSSHISSSNRKSENIRNDFGKIDNENGYKDTMHNKKKISIKNDENNNKNNENNNRNVIRYKKDYKRSNNENLNRNAIHNQIQYKKTIDVNTKGKIQKGKKTVIKKHYPIDNKINESDEISNKTKLRNEKNYQKVNMKIVKLWALKLNENHEMINDGEVRDLLGLLFIWMLNLLDPIIPKSISDSFIKLPIDILDKSYNDKYNEFIDNMPLLHKNTLKYLIGFLREIAQNKKLTHETHESIADIFGSSFVRTSFLTIDPFTRKKMYDISPHFILYCLDNLDVSDVYPLNTYYEIQIKNKY